MHYGRLEDAARMVLFFEADAPNPDMLDAGQDMEADLGIDSIKRVEILSAMSERYWVVFPAFGWGIGLLIHGAVVFLVTGGGGLHERLVQQERKRLSLQRDPW